MKNKKPEKGWMTEMKFKIFIVILALVLLGGIFFPLPFVSGQGFWVKKITISSIEMSPVAGEHSDCLEYLNTTHTLKINVVNSGNVYLKDLNVSYQILKQGNILELQGHNSTEIDLGPGEAVDPLNPITFYWTPSEEGKWYLINVTLVKADYFGSVEAIEVEGQGLNVTIKEITDKVEPIGYELSGQPISEIFGGIWPYATSNVTVRVKNLGNVNVFSTTDIDVEATIYNNLGEQIWTDNTTINENISAGEEMPVILKQWAPPSILMMCTINMSTSISGSSSNLSMPLAIRNITDARLERVIDYRNGGSYANDSIRLKVGFKNSGNQRILDQYEAELEIREKTTNALRFEDIAAIPQEPGNNITDPNNTAQVTFKPWNAATGIMEGDYWLNVTLINATEKNGSSLNNKASFWIHIEDIKTLEVFISRPARYGMYPHSEMKTGVKAFVKNAGTLYLDGYELTLTIEDKKSGVEVFNDAVKVSERIDPGESSAIHSFAPWTDTYNGYFKINVTVRFAGETTIKEHYFLRSICIAGEPLSGNISGKVASGGKELEGVTVRAIRDGQVYKEVKTDANGTYALNVPAPTTPGRIYNVSVYKYGYEEDWNPNVTVINGKETTGIDFDIAELIYWKVIIFNPTGDDVELGEIITVKFSESMDNSSVESAFSIAPEMVDGTFSWSEDNTTFTWVHDDFELGETYTIRILKTARSSLDRTGLSNVTWTFSTLSPPIFNYEIGPILDEKGKAVANADWTITHESEGIIYGKTDSRGYIVLTKEFGLPADNYTVEVSKHGYEPITLSFEVDKDGDIIHMSATMKKSSPKEASWIGYAAIIILIIIITIFFVIAFAPKKLPEREKETEEERMEEEELPKEEEGAEEVEEEEPEDEVEEGLEAEEEEGIEEEEEPKDEAGEGLEAEEEEGIEEEEE